MDQSSLKPMILKYGLTGGLIMSLIFLVGTITGLATSGSKSYGIISGLVSFIIVVVLIVLAIKGHRDDLQDGYISLGQCVLIGTAVLILTGLISYLVSLVYMKVIDPEYMNRMMASMEEAWEAQGLSEEQIESAKKWTGVMKSPGLSLAVILCCYGLGGAILSLIAGLIMKKDKPEFS
ncbi:MAG: DUF4199 domain-containing protein [Saprospiraceae bacterium]